MMFGGNSDHEVRRKMWWRIISCILHVLLGIFNITSDWLFYAELKVTEKGLVYGPVDERVLQALLAFCIIGTIIFFGDLFCHVYVLCPCLKKFEKCANPHLISILVVLFGDIPQVSIRICVACCREQGLSYIQITKTTCVFLGGLIRIFIFIFAHRKEKLHKSFKWVMAAGLVIHLILMIIACGLGYAHQKSPTNTIEEQYDDEKYLHNVSVFFQHPKYNSPNSWISVMSIYDIYNKPDISLLYIYRYEESTTHWRFAIWTKKFQKGLNLTGGSPECYQMELTTGSMSTVNMSDCWNSLFSQPTTLYVNFTYTPPEYIFRIIRKKLFGDIVYNMKVMKNNSCITQDMFAASGDGLASPTFGYFRVNANVANFTGAHLLLDNGQPRFYRSHQDLQDIGEVWRTGTGSCETSGNLAPTIDSNIEVDCSN